MNTKDRNSRSAKECPCDGQDLGHLWAVDSQSDKTVLVVVCAECGASGIAKVTGIRKGAE